MDIKLLDPELSEVLGCSSPIDIWEDVGHARAQGKNLLREIQAKLPPVTGVIIENRLVSNKEGSLDVPVRIYRPEHCSTSLPGLLWIHGGGYVFGSIENSDYFVQQLVNIVGCMAVSVEYRLAPEHPFPASLDDCYAVLRWLFLHANELGLDSSRIAVGGNSAGGGLAGALALLVRDRGEFCLNFQMLLCPMIDDRNITPSSHTITDPRVWNRDCNLRAWRAYLGQDAGAENVSSYAAIARAKNLENVAPAYISVGSLDLFIDENIDYAQRLIQAGVPTELHVFPGGFHVYEFVAPNAHISRRTCDNHYAALKSAFGLSSI